MGTTHGWHGISLTSPPWQGAVHACDVGDGTAGTHSCQDLGGDETVLEPQKTIGKTCSDMD